MTGTGTENDPYVVYSFQELLDKVQEQDCYVKLGADIHIKDDPVYREGLSGNINITCSKLYSDSSNIKSIYGLLFRPNFSNSNSYCVSVSNTTTIQYINFLSILVDGGGPYILDLFRFGSNTIIKNVAVSALNRLSNYSCSSCPILGGLFDTCSIYIKTVCTSFQRSGRDGYLQAAEMNHCYIYIDGLRFQLNGRVPMLRNVKNSTVYGNDIDTYVDSSFNNGEFVFLDSSGSYPSTHNLVYLNAYIRPQWASYNYNNVIIRDSGITVACLDVTNIYGKAPSPVGVVQLTLDQLKDEESLVNSGFLP